MSTLFFILMLGAMLAVLGSFGIGMYFMSRQDQESRLKSNQWMRIRVMMQGVALALFALAVLTK